MKGRETMSEKNPQDKVRKTLEDARARLSMRIGLKALRRIKIALIALAVTTILVLAAVLFIKVDSIEVTGDVTMFNESEVIAASGIDIGDGLFSLPTWEISKNIKKNMPLAESVTVTKTPFGKVTIDIKLRKLDYFTKIGDKYYAIDESLTVLDSNASGSKYSAYGAVLVKLPAVREPILGQPLVFYDTVEEENEEGETLYELRDESFYRYVSKFLTALSESKYHAAANGVILTEKFDVTLIYDGKYQIRFGSVSDLDVKLRILDEILEGGSLEHYDLVSVDISDTARPTARPDLTLDFSEYID